MSLYILYKKFTWPSDFGRVYNYTNIPPPASVAIRPWSCRHWRRLYC